MLMFKVIFNFHVNIYLTLMVETVDLALDLSKYAPEWHACVHVP